MNVARPIISASAQRPPACHRPRRRKARRRPHRPRRLGAGAAGSGHQYSEKGADTCLGCHDEDADTATFTTAAIFKTRMRTAATRMRRSAPAACSARPATAPAPGTRPRAATRSSTINSFKASSFLTVAERNAAVPRAATRTSARTGWHASAHERSAWPAPIATSCTPSATPCWPRPTSPTSASTATRSSAPISRSRRRIRCASA